jgi:hypothetical protein
MWVISGAAFAFTLQPKLALSCSKKISAAVTSAPAAVRADRLRSK